MAGLLTDGADVGVIECGSSARFAAKAFAGERVVIKVIREEFKRDKTA
jgi:hypothetical protein